MSINIISTIARTAWIRGVAAFAIATLALSYLATGTLATETVHERYPDGNVKIERGVTLDREGNYVNHGIWKQWNTDGKLVAEGQYQMGLRTGDWTRWYDRQETASLREPPFTNFAGPFVAQASFENDRLHGDWLIFDSNQQKCIQVSLENGQRHGPTTMWLPTGKIYRQSIYENGMLVGKVRQRDRAGELQTVGTYVGGRRVTTKVTYFNGTDFNETDAKKTEAHYLQPKLVATAADNFWSGQFAQYKPVGRAIRHGAWKTWFPSGQLHIDGSYENDKENGTFAWWHPNGQQAVLGVYAAGEKHGPWTWWHASGLKSTAGAFHRGIQTGRWRTWNENGHLDHQIAFDHTKAVRAPVAQTAPSISR